MALHKHKKMGVGTAKSILRLKRLKAAAKVGGVPVGRTGSRTLILKDMHKKPKKKPVSARQAALKRSATRKQHRSKAR